MSKKHFQKKQKNRRTLRNRAMIGLILIVLMSAVLLFFVGRFAYIAASGHAGQVDLTKKTQQQYRQQHTIKARRGTIYDSNDDVLAEDSNVYTLYAVLDKSHVDQHGKPLYVKDKDKTASVLSHYLSLSQATIMKYLRQKNFQVEFGSAGQNLSLATKKAIEAEKLPGINFEEIPSRLYPNGTFASHLVGLAQLKASKDDKDQSSTSQLQGILGIEKYFNQMLAGKNGHQTTKTDSFGYELPGSQVTTKAAEDGADIYLTLDSRLQSYLEQLLQAEQEEFQPKQLNAVLMNAKTGKILAASQRPTFNAATKKGLTSTWRDSLVEDTYEPGSVFKLLTIAAAIDAGTYTPNATYQSGSVEVDGTTIRDWNTYGWGRIPFSQVIPRSSNTGTVAIEQQMGSDVWKNYLDRFKFGEKTGITLPGEVNGDIQFKTAVDRATTSFGQGLRVTAMQMMSYLSAIANDGQMLQPQIVSKTVSNSGKTKKYQPQVLANPISADTAKQVRDLMKQVVDAEYGTGKAFKIPGYDQQIAVKTGTAQIIGDKGQYLTGEHDYIYSVAGMAPADDPEYIFYFTVQQPQKMDVGESEMLAKVFNPLMKRALRFQGTRVDTDENAIKMPQLIGKTTTTAKKAAKAKGLTLVQVGQGSKVVQQLPTVNSKVIHGQKMVVLTEGAMTMPNVVGWSKNDVLKLAEITGCDFKLSGSGYVKKQSLTAGKVLSTKETVTITLTEP